MVEAHVMLNGVSLGSVRCRNTGKQTKRGYAVYDVLYVHPIHTFKFQVFHCRKHGVESLFGKAFKQLSLEKRNFFRFPTSAIIQDESQGPLVRPKDVPERYREAFMAWMGGQTVGCTKNGDIAIYYHDLERWLKSQIDGCPLSFD